jgi:hypothetical protein
MASSSHTLINSGGDGEVATRVYKAAVCHTGGVTRGTAHLGKHADRGIMPVI